VETITDLFEISGEFVTQDVSQNLMTLIAEGSGDEEEDSEEADIILRQHSVTIYANLLSKSVAKLPQLLIETMAWVLGEYAYLSDEYTLEEILNELCSLVTMGKQLAPSTRKIIMSAIMKLVAQAGQCPPDAAKIIDDFSKSKDVDLQQRCLEFQNLITTAPHLLGEVLPVDASCEDIQVDPNLSFLDTFVQRAIVDGAKQYEKPEDDDDDDEYYQTSSKKASAFKMTPYEKPTKPGAAFSTGSMGGIGKGSVNGTSSISGVTPPPGAYGGNAQTSNMTSSSANSSGEPQLNVRNVANVWGRNAFEGTITATAPVAAPVPVSAPSSVWSNSTYTPSTTSQSHAAPPSEPVKSEEQIRKEKMAAALFGGGQSTPSTPVRVARRTAPRNAATRTTITSTSSSFPVAPVPPVAAPVPAPAPAVDLLDFMSDPSPAVLAMDSGVDILAPSPIIDHIPPPEPEPTSAPALEVDPFAASGLLDGFNDTPLTALVTDNKFQHNGQTLGPLQITTPQFGEKWGTTPHSSPLSTDSGKYNTLDTFMDLCKKVGAHNIESIPTTNEGICAGMLGGGKDIVLIHGKVSSGGRVDVTIKSTDASIGGCLAMYMQNMMR
jgi:AP-4 complex subunit epsilon-1